MSNIIKSICRLSICLIVGSSYAGEKVALLIANAKYENMARLEKPYDDVKLIEKSLLSLGFDKNNIKTLRDLDQRDMKQAFRDFGDKAQNADIAFFYYSGHGLQHEGTNYLVPLKSQITKDSDIDIESVSAQSLLTQLDKAKVSVLVLDACRDNPWLRQKGAAGKGLARMDIRNKSLIAFATSENNTAADEGLYAQYLAQYLLEPNLGLKQVFDKVGAAIDKATNGKQQPRVYSGIYEDIYLADGALQSVTTEVLTDPELLFWNSIINSSEANDYLAYLQQYPQGRFANLAKSRYLSYQQSANYVSGLKGNLLSWLSLVVLVLSGALYVWLKSYGQLKAVLLAVSSFVGVMGLSPLLGKTEKTSSEAVAESSDTQAQESANTATVVAAEPTASTNTSQPAPETTVTINDDAAGQSFKDCADCPEMVVVPSGSFMMGSNDGYADEKPVHKVTIAYSFAVGKYEVSKGQFATFVSETGYKAGNSCWVFDTNKDNWQKKEGYHWRNVGYEQADTHPVSCVNWEDAQAYVKWLSRKTGKSYRLLSESEWEYVARGGKASQKWLSGANSEGLCEYSNTADRSFNKAISNYEYADCEDGYVYTSPIGSFAPNGFGLYDVSGNVWEWVEDCWHDNYNNAPSDGSAWTVNCTDDRRILRGGSWDDRPIYSRLAVRVRDTADGRDNYNGFRVVRSN